MGDVSILPGWGHFYFALTALNMSLDKTAIGRYLNSPPARGLMPPIAGYSGPESVFVNVRGRDYDVLAYNPAGAREILAAAGYSNVTGSNRVPLTLELHAWNMATHVNVAQIMARQWMTNLGVQVHVRPTEFNAALAEPSSGNSSGLATGSWLADYADPMAILTPYLVYGGGWNDPHYIPMLSEANRAHDPQGRFGRLARAEELVMRAMPLLPLTFMESHYLRKPWVRAEEPDLLSQHHFRYTWIDTEWKP